MAYSGTGTINDPYLVSTFADFIDCIAITDAYVKVTSDIHASDDDSYEGNITLNMVFNCAKVYADTRKVIDGYTINSNMDAFNIKNTCVIEKISFTNFTFNLTAPISNRRRALIFSDSVTNTIYPTLINVSISCRVSYLSTSDFNVIQPSYIYLENTALDIDMIDRNALDKITYQGGSYSSGYLQLNNCNIVIRHAKFDRIGNTTANSAYILRCNNTAIILYECSFDSSNTASNVIRLMEYCYNSYVAIITPTVINDDHNVHLKDEANTNCLFMWDATGENYYHFYNLTTTFKVVTPEQLKNKEYLISIGFLP